MGVSTPRTLSFAVRGPVDRDDHPGLCDRVCALLEGSRADVAYCDVGGVEPNAVVVDALCRLQVAARRRGCQVRLRNASAELLDLVSFVGLCEILVDD
jgi:ABC-type transporter Mla MlaB component